MQKRKIVGMLSVCCVSLVSFAQFKALEAKRPTRPVDSAMRSNFLAHTGGFIKSQAQGPHIQIINMQKRVAFEVVDQAGQQLGKTLRTEVEVQNVALKEVKEVVAENLKNPNVAVLLVIIDDPQQPSMLIAPEAKWGLLNVATLGTGTIDKEGLSERLRKQIWRTTGYLMGSAYTGTGPCVMKPVFKAEDLDALGFSTLSPEALLKIQMHLGKYGITPERIVPYRKACEDGWAPMPTNALQKAVWEDVKAKKATNPVPPVTK